MVEKEILKQIFSGKQSQFCTKEVPSWQESFPLRPPHQRTGQKIAVGGIHHICTYISYETKFQKIKCMVVLSVNYIQLDLHYCDSIGRSNVHPKEINKLKIVKFRKLNVC